MAYERQLLKKKLKESQLEIKRELYLNWLQEDHYCKNCGSKLTIYYSPKSGQEVGEYRDRSCLLSYKAKHRSPESIRLAINNRRSYAAENNPNYGKHYSDKSKMAISKGNREYRLGCIWMTNNVHRCQVRPENIDEFLQKGYIKGRGPNHDKK